MNKRISESQRKEEFYGVEGGVYTSYVDPETGENTGLSSLYVPTPMSKVKKETGISIFAITQAKLKGGMYPWQQKLAQILGGKKDQ